MLSEDWTTKDWIYYYALWLIAIVGALLLAAVLIGGLLFGPQASDGPIPGHILAEYASDRDRADRERAARDAYEQEILEKYGFEDE